MQLIATFLALLTVAQAQRVAIGSPLDQTTLSAGQQTVVEIDRPVSVFHDSLPVLVYLGSQNFQSSAQEVAVVIGIQSCAATPCAPPDGIMGQILYSGSFNPQFDTSNTQKPPHQNFTVTLPSNLPKGSAQIGIAHFSLIGVSLAFSLFLLCEHLMTTSLTGWARAVFGNEECLRHHSVVYLHIII